MNIVLPVPRDIFLLAASNEKLVAVKLLSSIVNPAIFPPSNNTAEPVISPDAFTLKLELDMKKSLSVAEELIKNESVKKASGDILNDAIDADLNEAKP